MGFNLLSSYCALCLFRLFYSMLMSFCSKYFLISIVICYLTSGLFGYSIWNSWGFSSYLFYGFPSWCQRTYCEWFPPFEICWGFFTQHVVALVRVLCVHMKKCSFHHWMHCSNTAVRSSLLDVFTFSIYFASFCLLVLLANSSTVVIE